MTTDSRIDLNTQQQADLYNCMARLTTNKQRQLFYEILIRKLLIKRRGFSDALGSAKAVFDDKYIDSIATDFTS